MVWVFSSSIKKEESPVFGENWDNDTTYIRNMVHEKWESWRVRQTEQLYIDMKGKKIAKDTVALLLRNVDDMAYLFEERDFKMRIIILFRYYYYKEPEKRNYYFTLRTILRSFFTHDKI
jgi:hypothetical protein